MKVAIIAGGRGSTALQAGLIPVLGAENISVITNMYDNGLTTGMCRQFFNYSILGPSDLRKNHSTAYRLTNFGRPCITETPYTGAVIKLIDLHPEFTEVMKEAIYIFHTFQEYVKDFTIGNILYSGLMFYKGVTFAAQHMAQYLGLPKNYVVPHATENAFLYCLTVGGDFASEEEVVEGKFFGKINDIELRSKPLFIKGVRSAYAPPPRLSAIAHHAIQEADLIIVSTGTVWSSIMPTLYADGLEAACSGKPMVGFVNRIADKDVLEIPALDNVKRINSKFRNSHIEWYADMDTENLTESSLIKRYPLSKHDTPRGLHEPELLAKLVVAKGLSSLK